MPGTARSATGSAWIPEGVFTVLVIPRLRDAAAVVCFTPVDNAGAAAGLVGDASECDSRLDDVDAGRSPCSRVAPLSGLRLAAADILPTTTTWICEIAVMYAPAVRTHGSLNQVGEMHVGAVADLTSKRLVSGHRPMPAGLAGTVPDRADPAST